MEEIHEIAKRFIDNSDYFSQKENMNLDEKHKMIVGKHYQDFDIKKTFTYENFRNWAAQDDLPVPVQLSNENIASKKVLKNIAKYILENTLWRGKKKFLINGLLDDLEIIKQIGGNEILLENPVSSSPGVKSAFRYQNYSINARWMRYIYLTKRILELFKDKEKPIWLDVGSFYGGLQGIVKKYKPNARMILLDFNHQLCRSYIYLYLQYPNSTHVFPNEIDSTFEPDKLSEGSIVYLPIEKYNIIENKRFSLATNFFSFGEMNLDTFLNYFQSTPYTDSDIVYLVNRFVSGPFFAKTYENETNIFNYINPKREVNYFDIFPMHYSSLVEYKLFERRKGLRPISSQYFEIVTKRKNETKHN